MTTTDFELVSLLDETFGLTMTEQELFYLEHPQLEYRPEDWRPTSMSFCRDDSMPEPTLSWADPDLCSLLTETFGVVDTVSPIRTTYESRDFATSNSPFPQLLWTNGMPVVHQTVTKQEYLLLQSSSPSRIESNVQGWLHKPVTEEELTNLIVDFLQSELPGGDTGTTTTLASACGDRFASPTNTNTTTKKRVRIHLNAMTTKSKRASSKSKKTPTTSRNSSTKKKTPTTSGSASTQKRRTPTTGATSQTKPLTKRSALKPSQTPLQSVGNTSKTKRTGKRLNALQRPSPNKRPRRHGKPVCFDTQSVAVAASPMPSGMGR